MAWLERDGVRLFYEVTEARSGHALGTIVLTHGFSSSSHMWAPNLDALAADHRVVTWDVRGHGRSDYPGDVASYAESLAVGDMAAILDAVAAPRAIVGGLSLGGYLSLAFHLAHPDRVRALMLFDTGPGYRSDEARARWNESALANAEAFEERGLDALTTRSEVRSDSHRDATGLALAARGMLTQHDARVIESLGSIRVPTLVLVGAADQPFLAAADYMAVHIPARRRSSSPTPGTGATSTSLTPSTGASSSSSAGWTGEAGGFGGRPGTDHPAGAGERHQGRATRKSTHWPRRSGIVGAPQTKEKLCPLRKPTSSLPSLRTPARRRRT